MTEPRDYVAIGIGRLPDGGRGPNTVRYLSVYLREIMREETAALALLDALREWNVSTSPVVSYSFAFDIVGRLIGQPRPSGFNDNDYRFILQARVLARASDATKPAVFKLIRHLAQQQPFGIITSVPEHWAIYFTLDLDEQWQQLYERLLLDAIAATDSLTLNFAEAGTALYDAEYVGYDEGTYG